MKEEKTEMQKMHTKRIDDCIALGLTYSPADDSYIGNGVFMAIMDIKTDTDEKWESGMTKVKKYLASTSPVSADEMPSPTTGRLVEAEVIASEDQVHQGVPNLEEAEVILKFSPALIDPKKEELQALALSVKEIDADPKNMTKESMELINTTKNILVKARTSIQKDGKAARKPATDFAKRVSNYENELIEIIAPAELRMKELEKAAKDFALKEERKKTLPEFKEKLATIGDEGNDIHDEMLLDLDPTQRDVYYNERLSAHLEAKQAELKVKEDAEAKDKEAEDLKLKEAQDKIAADKIAIQREKENLRAQRLITLGFKDMGSSFHHDVEIFQKRAVMVLSDEEFDSFLIDTSEKVNQWSIKKKKEADDKAAQDIKDAADKATKDAEDKAAEKEADRIAAEKKIKDDKIASDKIAADNKEKAESEERFVQWKGTHSNISGIKDYRFDEETNITILFVQTDAFNHNEK